MRVNESVIADENRDLKRRIQSLGETNVALESDAVAARGVIADLTAERDAIASEKKQLREHASELIVLRDTLRTERDALAARIEAVEALRDDWMGYTPGSHVRDIFGPALDRALSGATEPAAGAVSDV